MTLENVCQKKFDAVTRARGEDCFKSGFVRLELIAPKAARFKVTQRQAQTLKNVCIDWSETATQGILRSNCSCETFQATNEPCEHIWAAILGTDESNQRELVTAKTLAAQLIESRKKLTLLPLPVTTEAELLKSSLDVEASQSWPLEKGTPQAVAILKPEGKTNDSLWIEPLIVYGGLQIDPLETEKILFDQSRSVRVERSAKLEKQFLASLKMPFTPRKLAANPVEIEDARTLIETLNGNGWRVEIEGKQVSVFSGFKGVLADTKDGLTFAAAFDFSGEKISLKSFSDASLNHENFAPLRSGRLGLLPAEWIKRIALLSRCAHFTKDGHMSIARASLPLLKPVFDELEDVVIDTSSKKAFSALSDLGTTGKAEKPLGLKADLRSYQAEGLHWLEKVAASGFGGILADDMGLGKTIQIISYLLGRTQLQLNSVNRRPSLVVLPKSLVFNWLGEIEKFAPRLKVLDFASASRGLLRTQNYDVVVTTYHVMKNEIDRLETVEFDTIILDEAQAIKNPGSQIAQAVFRLKGRIKFALSGTPIENSLGDLFSLMRFTNPGLIPQQILSIANSADIPKDVLKKLSVAVSPFVLRRTKKQVLKELPDKSEQTLLCDLEGDQKKMYDRIRKEFKASLKKKDGEEKSNKPNMRVFEALLRLRQASCHPGLIDPALAKDSSAKFEVLLEHLEEIKSSGNKALVFSQFTSLLELLKPVLKEAGIQFEYLDGQTRDRGAVVQKFTSNDETTVFLISLKAGGTGLNLTCASYVFLLDPWWNPAAEAQAIDRAYRMGQKQKVMAYRLIAKGTIEEKIMRLQKQKRSLANAVISDDQSFLRTLSIDDLESLFD